MTVQRGSRGRPKPVWTTRPQAVALVLRGATVAVAAPVALVVGTVLSLVNQGAVLLEGGGGWATWVRVAVNYLIPFLVASLGYLSGCRAPTAEELTPPTDGGPASRS